MGNNAITIVDVLIIVGAVIMTIASISTYNLIRHIRTSRYLVFWRMLFVLMLFFLLGYIGVIFVLRSGNNELLFYLVGLIFLFGALFVFLVVHTGSLTIQDLLDTTVSKIYVENIIHSMADTLIVINTDENASIRTVNSATLNLLRYAENDLIGQSVKKILSPDLFSKAHILQLTDLDMAKNIETSYMTSDGEEIPIRFSASVLTDSVGTVEGVIYVAQDIRENKKAEEQIKSYIRRLKESEEKLKELNASKDKFFSIIAHDLRNPFGSVLGYSEIIAGEWATLERTELKTFAEMLHHQTRAIYDLLENLLMWSRMQTGRMNYNPIDIKVDEKLEELDIIYRGNCEKKNIILNIINDVTSLVFADENMFFTILRNLVSNAIKFSPMNSIIKVQAKEDDAQIVVSVEDNGVGISEEDQRKLFRIDVQHSTMGTGDEKGTGLGLILCKDLVEINGGKIWVESILGRGSKFIFTIPKK